MEENVYDHYLDSRKCLVLVTEWIIFLYLCDFPLITHLLIDVFDYSLNKYFTSTEWNHWVRAVSWKLGTLGSILSSPFPHSFFKP